MTDASPADPAGKLLDGRTLLLAGAGRMGGAMLDAWLDGGLDPRRVSVIDPQPDPALADRLRRLAIELNPSGDRAMPVDVMLLAIKPQMLAAAAPRLAAHTGPHTLVISVVAGKTMANLRAAFPAAAAIARAMPNTPAAIRRGIAGVAVEPQATALQRAAIEELLAAVGAVEWLDDESLIDVVTAVSGSGPAYVFYLVECLAKAAEAGGLERQVALRLARATIEGAGALLEARPDETPAGLRHNVTSPGGTTAAALDVFQRDDALARLVGEAVEAARRRAAELAG